VAESEAALATRAKTAARRAVKAEAAAAAEQKDADAAAAAAAAAADDLVAAESALAEAGKACTHRFAKVRNTESDGKRNGDRNHILAQRSDQVQNATPRGRFSAQTTPSCILQLLGSHRHRRFTTSVPPRT